jgi:hypothetical protein
VFSLRLQRLSFSVAVVVWLIDLFFWTAERLATKFMETLIITTKFANNASI